MSETPSRYGYAATGKIARACLRCGVLVGDTDVHDEWHDGLLDWMTKVAEAAHIHEDAVV